jgi:tetratricopeptide (TPR) repeat protein
MTMDAPQPRRRSAGVRSLPRQPSFTITLAVVFVALAAAPLLGQTSDRDARFLQAAKLIDSRHINPPALAAGMQILEQLAAQYPRDTKILPELSRACFLSAERSASDKVKCDLYGRGVDAARKAIEIDSNAEFGHLWYLINLGRHEELKGFVTALASIPEITKEADIILRINPRNTDALAVKADICAQLPGFLGGDLKKAERILDQGLQIDPKSPLLLNNMAKIHIRTKEYAEARKYLEKVLALVEPQDAAGYMLDDRPAALKLLEEIKGK